MVLSAVFERFCWSSWDWRMVEVEPIGLTQVTGWWERLCLDMTVARCSQRGRTHSSMVRTCSSKAFAETDCICWAAGAMTEDLLDAVESYDPA